MKRFLRTTAGKAITFILCILSFCVLAISIAGAYAMVHEGIYAQPESDFLDENIYQVLKGKGRDLILGSLVYASISDSRELPASDSSYTIETSDAAATDLTPESDIAPEYEHSSAASPEHSEDLHVFIPAHILQMIHTKNVEATVNLEESSVEVESDIGAQVYTIELESAARTDENIITLSAEEWTAAVSPEIESEVSLLYNCQTSDVGNLIFQILDNHGNELAHSTGADTVSEWQYALIFHLLKNDYGFVKDAWYSQSGVPGSSEFEDGDYCILHVSLRDGLPEQDNIQLLSWVVHTAYTLRYAVYIIGGLSLLLMIICFIILMCVSARRPDTEELHPGPLYRVPFDLMLAGTICLGYLLFIFTKEVFFYQFPFNFNGNLEKLLLIGYAILYLNILLGLCMSLAARLKLHTLLRNNVIAYILRGLWKLLRIFVKGIGKLPLIWKTVLLVFVITLVEFLAIGFSRTLNRFSIFWVVEKLILIPCILYYAYSLRRLQHAGKALADGDLEHHIDTKGLWGNLKRHGEDLNSIADAMTTAVDKRTRSERMKAELITNVSHDIKTPLTSIINYAGLIGAETCDNPKITEYSEVLVRQSERLKRLIEDLVEASKASTGNLDVQLTPCDANVFLNQIIGEYAEKLENANLQPVVHQPDHEVQIMADGRRMWRIFDNMMNNICKYALPGTRVYLTLEETAADAIITFKNTSRDPLDIPAEELLERFTRGDASRSSDGNGLGLAIARSMAELQGGTLELTIDGDFFKAALRFPKTGA